MENTRTPTDDTAAPAQSHAPHLEQLREMADALLQAYKAAPVPKDHAGIGKAARTLISLTRLIKAVFAESAAPKRRRPETPSADVTPEAETQPALVPALNRKQRRREDKLHRSVKMPERAVVAMSP